ncbi:hypothetical protein PoB_000834700 [Plakobranchus ocellatus]|uniref:Uncharacterized protein n=1 Tax=Plakobranchus ocellatus TaxID=259542 RepID=A0AAV3YG55_9GAST|nr:hypothetical protein PoB_000834700 [Plakobranchus ocellatus]
MYVKSRSVFKIILSKCQAALTRYLFQTSRPINLNNLITSPLSISALISYQLEVASQSVNHLDTMRQATGFIAITNEFCLIPYILPASITLTGKDLATKQTNGFCLLPCVHPQQTGVVRLGNDNGGEKSNANYL